jgi:hypothetical protein
MVNGLRITEAFGTGTRRARGVEKLRTARLSLGRQLKSRARNHLQANRSLGFCFGIPI